MKRILLVLGIAGFSILAGTNACTNSKEKGGDTDSAEAEKSEKPDSSAMKLQARASGVFSPLPEPASFDRPVARLGKKLFYEKGLSESGKMSCNTCHQLDDFGVDHDPVSFSHDSTAQGERNSPSVYNAYTHIAQFWDGRAADLVEQAKGPILNPVEMAMPDKEKVEQFFNESDEYQKLFAKAFPEEEEPVSFHNMAVAIAEFEKTLATPGDFDKYLEGEYAALSDMEQKGLKTFMDVGCITCHIGPAVGGNMYKKFGLVKGPYWEWTESDSTDLGRYEVTEKESDKYVFKVPSLRNVTETAPYFHDGSVESLNEAIKIMGATQLGRGLSPRQVREIKVFLESLTGEIPEHALREENQQMAAR